MVRIAIEATGCDNGFEEVLNGARKVIRANKDLELILVAGKDKLPKVNSFPKRIFLERVN